MEMSIILRVVLFGGVFIVVFYPVPFCPRGVLSDAEFQGYGSQVKATAVKKQ